MERANQYFPYVALFSQGEYTVRSLIYSPPPSFRALIPPCMKKSVMRKADPDYFAPKQDLDSGFKFWIRILLELDLISNLIFIFYFYPIQG